jgi:hypothetical protein
LIELQSEYHATMERLVAEAPSAQEAQRAIRARWPGLGLEAAIATATARRWP